MLHDENQESLEHKQFYQRPLRNGTFKVGSVCSAKKFILSCLSGVSMSYLNNFVTINPGAYDSTMQCRFCDYTYTESAHNPYDGVQKYYEARKLINYLQKAGFTVVISPELSYDV